MIVRELQFFLKYLQRGLLRTTDFVGIVKGMITALEGPEKLLRKSKKNFTSKFFWISEKKICLSSTVHTRTKGTVYILKLDNFMPALNLSEFVVELIFPSCS